jgi:hypothetical protein
VINGSIRTTLNPLQIVKFSAVFLFTLMCDLFFYRRLMWSAFLEINESSFRVIHTEEACSCIGNTGIAAEASKSSRPSHKFDVMSPVSLVNSPYYFQSHKRIIRYSVFVKTIMWHSLSSTWIYFVSKTTSILVNFNELR